GRKLNQNECLNEKLTEYENRVAKLQTTQINLSLVENGNGPLSEETTNLMKQHRIHHEDDKRLLTLLQRILPISSVTSRYETLLKQSAQLYVRFVKAEICMRLTYKPRQNRFNQY